MGVAVERSKRLAVVVTALAGVMTTGVVVALFALLAVGDKGESGHERHRH